MSKLPICSHPELTPTAWSQQRPEPCRMIGCCERSCVCPVCGFGWDEMPHKCRVAPQTVEAADRIFGTHLREAWTTLTGSAGTGGHDA